MTTEKIEALREREDLRVDRADTTHTRMIARDGSVWPNRDTGYRHVSDRAASGEEVGQGDAIAEGVLQAVDAPWRQNGKAIAADCDVLPNFSPAFAGSQLL